jgi:hypothetical protein
VVSSDSTHRDHSHDLITELVEEFALKRLGGIVGNHLFGETIFDGNLLAANAIGDEKITNLDVAGAFSTRRLAVVREFDCTLIILVQDCSDAVAL